MDSGISSPPIPPRRNAPHKRTPRKIKLASTVLTPVENEQVRAVMVEAKKRGRKFVATVTETKINGQLVEREVNAWTEQRPTVPKSQRPLCGARCRDGHPCRSRVVEKPNGTLSKRCRMHGGKSTGPTTEAGREAIRESNRRRAGAKAARAQATST